MFRALCQEADISVGINGAIVEVAGAQDVTFISQYATAFKLQGSTDGVTYNDIEGSLMSGDGSVDQRLTISVWQSRFSHLKAVLTSLGGETASVAIIRRQNRVTPSESWDADFNLILIDPEVGTA